MTRVIILFGILGLALFGVLLTAIAADRSPQDRRDTATKAMTAGNFKDAYDALSKLLDPADEAGKVSDDLTACITCLQRLGRSDEIDDLREKAIAAHAANWQLLWTAAKSYVSGENFGYIVAGKFYRGHRRGNDGKYAMSAERDRVRALQLMQSASEKLGAAGKAEAGEFYFSYASMLLDSRQGNGAWRLQYLTDTSKLPDYDEGYRRFGGGNDRGAPVNEDGSPVYHALPKSWNDAKTDGERWRWCLKQAADLSPELSARGLYLRRVPAWAVRRADDGILWRAVWPFGRRQHEG